MITLLSEQGKTGQVIPASIAGAYSRNTFVAITATCLGFAPNDYAASETNLYFITEADECEVDAAADTYAIDDLVYDANPSPTGIVNKTSGAGRQVVGKVIKPVTLGAQGKLWIKFRGSTVLPLLLFGLTIAAYFLTESPEVLMASIFAIGEGIWPKKKASDAEIGRAGMSFAADPELQRRCMERIREGVIDGRRDQKVLNAHFHLRSWMELPTRIFRESLAAGKDTFKRAVDGLVLAYNADAKLPDLVTRNFQSFRSFENYDLRCFEAFRLMQFEEGRDYLEVPKLTGGVTIHKRKPGKKVQLSEFEGDFVKFTAQEYGGGMQWSKSLLRNRQFNALLDISRLFVDSAVAHQSKETYQTLGAAAIANATTALVVTGANAFENLILTINKACDDLANDLKDEVGIDAANAEFLLYVNAGDARVSQVRAALAYVTAYNNTVATVITARPIRLMPTFNLRDSTGTVFAGKYGVLCLAGRENVYGDKLTPTMYEGEDIFTFSNGQTVEMSFAVGAANNVQQRRVELFAS